MRNLTTSVRETESKCGRFWIFVIAPIGRYVLCRRKSLPLPKDAKKDTPKPWEYHKIGSYPDLCTAVMKANETLEMSEPYLQWTCDIPTRVPSCE